MIRWRPDSHALFCIGFDRFDDIEILIVNKSLTDRLVVVGTGFVYMVS